MANHSDAFQKAMHLLLQREGGYINHPNDRGGPTNMGITMSVLGAWRSQKVTKLDVQNLEVEESMEIYKSNYWNPLKLDSVSDHRLAVIFFDQSVNRGTRTVAKQIQSTVGVKKDGVVGPLTLQSINNANPLGVGLSFIKQAQMQYVRIAKRDPSQLIFLEGWLARTHHLFDILFWREISTNSQ